MNTEDKPKKPHHHGDLRRALITSSMQLLAEGGSAALTLRRAAAAAGVSHAAPTHHFGNLDGLRSAVATEGFTLFNQAMAKHVEAAEPDPRARLTALCMGYLEFALRHPSLLDLMFREERSYDTDPALLAASTESYQALSRTAAPFVSAAQPARITEAQIWSFIHGYAVLRTSGRFGRDADDPSGDAAAILSLLDRLELAPSSQAPAAPL
jgi:AcrR family transcriptional regulator